VNTTSEWLEYVREVVRLYPYRVERYDSLDDTAKKECDAVAAACRLLDLEQDGDVRLQVIRSRYWNKPRRSVELIAMDTFTSASTVKRMDSKFMRNVAALLGVYKESNSAPALPPS